MSLRILMLVALWPCLLVGQQPIDIAKAEAVRNTLWKDLVKTFENFEY